VLIPDDFDLDYLLKSLSNVSLKTPFFLLYRLVDIELDQALQVRESSMSYHLSIFIMAVSLFKFIFIFFSPFFSASLALALTVVCYDG
jgi:hypothetical protein